VEEHGFENVLPVEIVSSDPASGVSQARFGKHKLKIPYCNRPAGSRIFAGIRADDIILSRLQPRGLSVRNKLEGRITAISNVRGKELVYIDVGRRIAAKLTPEAISELDLKVDDPVYCLIKTHSIRIGPEVD
jgi:molybdate transport system ATP-binding protein